MEKTHWKKVVSDPNYIGEADFEQGEEKILTALFPDFCQELRYSFEKKIVKVKQQLLLLQEYQRYLILIVLSY